MFLVKILGLIDLLAAFLLLAIAAGVDAPLEVLIFIPLCLLLKASIALADAGGLTDLAIGILLVLSVFFPIHPYLLYIGAAIIGLKGLESLAA
ncbi:MAG: hypothetical protein PHW33_03285 [Candidatus Portnoybacteria bacterium]|jgi:hypothetical protein|nr:hypothetical protein [Candidatus Portnoybacteria bacterium]